MMETALTVKIDPTCDTDMSIELVSAGVTDDVDPPVPPLGAG
jgi:hypothetical protein